MSADPFGDEALRQYLEQVILLPTVGRERTLAEMALELLDRLEARDDRP